MFPLSSIARLCSVAVPEVDATQLYDQLVVPMAGCQVLPPSVDTSTPATTPPTSAAVPVMEMLAPLVNEAPAVGEVMTEVGSVVSVDRLAGTKPVRSEPGCAFMSASKLMVACCMLTSAAV